jgi:hypothetical protein
MLINLAIDAKVRAATKRDGLYAVWREYLQRPGHIGSPVSKEAYLEAASAVGGPDVAKWVEKAVAEPDANLILGQTNP